MAGVPHHAADGYIARLIGKGYRVAVCEQVSDPALSKGLVEREVMRVVTPGTVVDPAMLAAKRNNYLAAAVLGRDAVGIAYADITTGEFACTQFAAAQPETALLQELARVQPAEVLVEATARAERAASPPARSAEQRGERVTEDDDEPERWRERLTAAGRAPGDRRHRRTSARAFREDVARERLREQFGVATLEAFGCEQLPLAIRAAGAVVAYLRETQRDTLAQITALETYSVERLHDARRAHPPQPGTLRERARRRRQGLAALGARRHTHADGRAAAAPLAGRAAARSAAAARAAGGRGSRRWPTSRCAPGSRRSWHAWATWSG